MSDQETAEVRKTHRGRSPGYPAIDLQEAIGKATVLWEKEHRHSAAVDVILREWNYSGMKSGQGKLALSSLRKYGLLEYEEGEKARLSDLAIAIVTDTRPDPTEREMHIREAAGKPAIFSDLLNRYPEKIPSNENIKFYLINERKFTENAANLVIKTFRATLTFAGMLNDDIISGYETDKEADESDDVRSSIPMTTITTPTHSRPREFRQPSHVIAAPPLQFLVTATGGVATISISEPWSEEAIDNIMSTLRTIKRSLTGEKQEDKPDKEAVESKGNEGEGEDKDDLIF